MKTGDIVTDSRAAAWTLQNLLGEGAWGRTWLVRDDGGRTRVLKCPYEAADLPPAQADRVPLMRATASEQAALLAEGHSHLIVLEDRIILPTGAVAILLPHCPTSLSRQLSSAVPLLEAIRVVMQVSASLAAKNATHGNLHPANVLITSDGVPVLTDALTPSLETLIPGADRQTPARKKWSPADRIASDTWALCAALYLAVMLEEPDKKDAPLTLPDIPKAGLDKVALAHVRDRAVARLRRDGANPRFIHRTAERLATLLARGLSAQADPSPPYRFLKAKDLLPRLSEVESLIQPGIESVGRLLLANTANGEVFNSPGPVGFSVSVGPTSGVTDADDLVCGVRLTDLDAEGDGRVPLDDAQFLVSRHPSGRLRFEFNLPDVAPGRYRVRVAFSVKDSGDEPAFAEGRFQVRPPPGYIPPVEDKEVALSPLAFAKPAPIPDPDDEDVEDAATVMMGGTPIHAFEEPTDPEATDASEPGGELIEAFPRPLAPTAPGTAVDPTPLPAPVAAPRPRPVLSALTTPPPSDAGESVVDHMPTPVPRPPRQPVESPSLVAPMVDLPPSVPVPPPSLAPRPSLQARPSIGVPAPVPAPLGTEPPQWQASQAHESEFFQPEGGLPRGGEDLVGDPKPSPFAALQAALGDFGRPDSPKFLVAVIGGCIVLILLVFLMLSAC